MPSKEQEIDAQDRCVRVKAWVPHGVEHLHTFPTVHVGEADFAEVFGFDGEGSCVGDMVCECVCVCCCCVCVCREGGKGGLEGDVCEMFDVKTYRDKQFY